MKKSFKQNNRSQKQTDTTSNTEKSNPKGSQHKYSKKNQINTIEIMKHSKLKSPFNVSHKKLSQHASDVQVSIKLKLCADKKLKIIKRLLKSIFSKQLLQFILN
ncbi:Hypothetical_protein [Hexamita inflata]|uniref:Hypothetical_protein n=1 Tax=Hexamita inflata TaxID=28002 RepID=A0AA86N7N2_9EUKA|nr:Hypothetical protein HINF_LOCUS1898 [Hexamita inflata]